MTLQSRKLMWQDTYSCSIRAGPMCHQSHHCPALVSACLPVSPHRSLSETMCQKWAERMLRPPGLFCPSGDGRGHNSAWHSRLELPKSHIPVPFIHTLWELKSGIWKIRRKTCVCPSGRAVWLVTTVCAKLLSQQQWQHLAGLEANTDGEQWVACKHMNMDIMSDGWW